MENFNQIDDKKVKEHFTKVAMHYGNDNAVLDSSQTKKSKHDNIYHHYSSLKAIKTNIPKNKNKIIIDFGCGTGRFFKYLSKSFNKVIATDVSEEMLKVASNRAIYLKNVEIVSQVDFYNKKVKADLAYSFWVLAHCSDLQLTQIFKRLNEVLNCQGAFYVFEQISKKGRYLSDIHNQRSIEEYKQIANEFGFTLESTKNIIRFPSYARSIWTKLPSWCKFLLPILYFIEQNTLNRKPQFVEYYTSLMVFRKL